MDDTYLHDARCESVGIRTTGSELLEEHACLVMLICIEKRDGLKYAMRGTLCEANVTYHTLINSRK
jgi:hypothetical protein